MSLSAHRRLLLALCWLAWCSRQTSGAQLDRRRTRPMQGCCGRHRSTSGSAAALVMRLNQPQDRMPPLRAPILTKMVVSASMASVLMRCCSSHNRSSDGLLIRTIRMRRMHHMRGGADDVTGLSTAALTASTHANRPWQRSPAVLAMRWQPTELLLVSRMQRPCRPESA